MSGWIGKGAAAKSILQQPPGVKDTDSAGMLLNAATIEPKSCDLSWFGRIDIVFLEIMATVQLYHFCFKCFVELFP